MGRQQRERHGLRPTKSLTAFAPTSLPASARRASLASGSTLALVGLASRKNSAPTLRKASAKREVLASGDTHSAPRMVWPRQQVMSARSSLLENVRRAVHANGFTQQRVIRACAHTLRLAGVSGDRIVNGSMELAVVGTLVNHH